MGSRMTDKNLQEQSADSEERNLEEASAAMNSEVK